MKRVLKIMLTIVLFIFIAIQFYQPALNVDKGQVYTTDFTQVYKMPIEVKAMLQTSCYDCHSKILIMFGTTMYNLQEHW